MRTIREIAQDIMENWNNPSPYAMPYLNGMLELISIDDKYFFDDGKSVVLYFLSNASGFRGNLARKLKAELKELIKQK